MKFPDPARVIEQQDEDTLLAMLVWGEARGESPEGRLAVAHIPLTRLRLRREMRKKSGNSLREIILSPWQFSCFNVKDPNREKLLRPVEAEGLGLWAACWRSAALALSDPSGNPASGATHYVVRRLWSRPAVDPSRPKWFEAPSISSGKTQHIATIGNHVFARSR